MGQLLKTLKKWLAPSPWRDASSRIEARRLSENSHSVEIAWHRVTTQRNVQDGRERTGKDVCLYSQWFSKDDFKDYDSLDFPISEKEFHLYWDR